MVNTALFHANAIACDLNPTGKKQLFQEMAGLILSVDHLQEENVSQRDIVTATLEREKLGSTGVGSGVALPHARLKHVTQVTAAFARLSTPLDYDSIDERPVDLVALLIAPLDAGGEHLRALAQISRRLRREDVRARLRAAPNTESLFITLTEDRTQSAA